MSLSVRTFQHDERCRFRKISSDGMRVVLRLTYQCDLACPHCLVGDIKSREPNFSLWEPILSQLKDINSEKVLITGGEPLLHEDVVKITAYISDCGIMVDLNSNLQRMTKTKIEAFYDAGLREISVSIEGPESVHDRLHGKQGAYYQLMKAVKWANDLGIRVDASCCLTKYNRDHIFQLLKNVENNHVKSFTISRMMPIGHGYKKQDAGLSQSELAAIYDKVKSEWSQKIGIPIRVVGLLGFPGKEDCKRGRSIIGITPDGRIRACVLGTENPEDIPNPDEAGLTEIIARIRDRLRTHEYAMCY